jgi:hypothetical protein
MDEFDPLFERDGVEMVLKFSVAINYDGIP